MWFKNKPASLRLDNIRRIFCVSRLHAAVAVIFSKCSLSVSCVVTSVDAELISVEEFLDLAVPELVDGCVREVVRR